MFAGGYWIDEGQRGLCGLLHSLARETWSTLARSHEHGLQPGEETLTDQLLLAIAEAAHRIDIPQLRVKAHSKYDEGLHGGDWDLWVVQDVLGVGMRFQAKVCETATQRFKHLHYESGAAKTSQAEKLVQEAHAAGMIPLFLLYQAWTVPHPSPHVATVGTFAHGCSLLTPRWVLDNVPPGSGKNLSDVAPREYPWEMMFCGLEPGASVPDGLVARLRQAEPSDAQGPTDPQEVPEEVARLLNDRLVEPLARPLVVIEVAPG